MSKEFLSVTFIIPTLNSHRFLNNCFSSIKNQDYPPEKIKIMAVDGGSNDETLFLARKFGVEIVHNEKILCEPAVVLGMQKASTDLCVIMGADNSLADKNWLREMTKPFENEEVFAAYPALKNKQTDTWLTKYVNTFTDPFNHFVYGYANNPLTFAKFYRKTGYGINFEAYDFSLKQHPILAFDQGFTIRTEYRNERPPETEYCDILPVIDIIEKKKMIAYVLTANNFHATLNGGVKQFRRKQKWAVDNGFVKKPYGFMERRKYLSLSRKIKQYLWPFYAISIVFPLLNSVYHLIKDKEKNWVYHLPITFIAGLNIWIEVIRIKIFRRPPLGSRQ